MFENQVGGFSDVCLLPIPYVINTNNNAGDEVLEDEADDCVEKSTELRLPILWNKLLWVKFGFG